jgi:NAD(P)-dependent dehydrogenase (short-subunit alcohol dehydrogenase family)
MKWALITGAEQGLGSELRDCLQFQGYEVHNILGDDLRNRSLATIGAIVEKIISEHGSVPDMVVLNFGIHHLSWVGDTPEEDEDIIRTNLTIPYFIANKVVEIQKLHSKDPDSTWPERQMVFVTSAAARINMRCSTLYGASKAGLNYMVKNLARELASLGWQVLGLAPGKIKDTRMSEMVDLQVCQLRGWSEEESLRYAISMVPEGRYTTTDEVGYAFVNLIAMPRYVQGHILEVMGGC